MKEIDIYDIELLNRQEGYHFFEPASMRFFSSRKPKTAYLNEFLNIAYFVTSEQFKASDGEVAQRKYTIRACDMITGNINTIGEFNQIATSREATKEAKRLSDKKPTITNKQFGITSNKKLEVGDIWAYLSDGYEIVRIKSLIGITAYNNFCDVVDNDNKPRIADIGKLYEVKF